MTNTMTISVEGDHIRVESYGEKTPAFARHVFTAIVEACKANDCYRVLGIGESTKALTILEGFDLTALFRELGISTKYRIAWVELNPAAVKTIRFIDAALFNRLLPGRVFRTEEEAKTWLFGDQGY